MLVILGCCLLFFWVARALRPQGARAVIAFLPASGMVGLGERDRENLAPWLAPCDLAGLELTSADFQPYVCKVLEKKAALNDLLPLFEQERIQGRALSDSLFEVRVEDRDSARAELVCQATLEFLQQALDKRWAEALGRTSLKDLAQGAEERLASQEEKVRDLWLSDPARNAGRTAALGYAFNRYQQVLVAKRDLALEQADKMELLEQNRPLFAVVVPPQPLTGDSL